MSNYLGRCKTTGCGYALFATPENVVEGETWADVKKGRATRVGNNGVFGRCDNGHKFFPLKLVKGTYSKDHKCDSRCLNARGNDCTCSCGGANHGMGHAITTHVASVEPTVLNVTVNPHDTVSTPASAHIGEVGKNIRGTATCLAAKHLDDSTLYTFSTDKGAIIKWFAPTWVSVEYMPGQKVTFRAKVKAHQEFRGEAQTVVTYLEEVS